MKEDYSEIQKATAYRLFEELRARGVWKSKEWKKELIVLKEFYAPKLQDHEMPKLS